MSKLKYNKKKFLKPINLSLLKIRLNLEMTNNNVSCVHIHLFFQTKKNTSLHYFTEVPIHNYFYFFIVKFTFSVFQSKICCFNSNKTMHLIYF